jgi:hypothetical protein
VRPAGLPRLRPILGRLVGVHAEPRRLGERAPTEGPSTPHAPCRGRDRRADRGVALSKRLTTIYGGCRFVALRHGREFFCLSR